MRYVIKHTSLPMQEMMERYPDMPEWWWANESLRAAELEIWQRHQDAGTLPPRGLRQELIEEITLPAPRDYNGHLPE